MTAFERSVLAAGGLIAAGIGTAIVSAPAAVYAGYGVALGSDPSLLSEIRAPGALLVVIGSLMIATAVLRAGPIGPALGVGAILYLSYFAGRAVSIVLDGPPHDGLVFAAILELAIGGLFAVALWRRYQKTPAARQRA